MHPEGAASHQGTPALSSFHQLWLRPLRETNVCRASKPVQTASPGPMQQGFPSACVPVRGSVRSQHAGLVTGLCTGPLVSEIYRRGIGDQDARAWN